MARPGVTQEQVDTAADALLLAGDRPTIDRVRQTLGTGSPNTLIKLLDTWWSALGRRLAAQEAKVALPEAPPAVVEAATAFWTSALEQSSATAAASVKGEREDLERERTLLAERAAESRAATERAQMDAQQAREAQALSDTRFRDVQRLVDAQNTRLSELQAQRENLTAELAVATQKAEDAEATLVAQLAVTASQRDTLEAQHRSSENRWLQEVDRARQETAQLQTLLKRRETDAMTAAQRAQHDADALRTSLREAERAQIASAAKVGALETEIARLHEQLSTTRRINRALPRKPRSKTAAPTPKKAGRP